MKGSAKLIEMEIKKIAQHCFEFEHFELRSDQKIASQIVAKENHFTLELPACSAEDSGQYTCRVSDAAGSANITCSAQLEVHQRENFSLKIRSTTYSLWM